MLHKTLPCLPSYSPKLKLEFLPIATRTEWVHSLSGCANLSSLICQCLLPHTIYAMCTSFFQFLSWPCSIFSSSLCTHSSIWMFFVLPFQTCFSPQLKGCCLQEILWLPPQVWSKYQLWVLPWCLMLLTTVQSTPHYNYQLSGLILLGHKFLASIG